MLRSHLRRLWLILVALITFFLFISSLAYATDTRQQPAPSLVIQSSKPKVEPGDSVTVTLVFTPGKVITKATLTANWFPTTGIVGVSKDGQSEGNAITWRLQSAGRHSVTKTFVLQIGEITGPISIRANAENQTRQLTVAGPITIEVRPSVQVATVGADIVSPLPTPIPRGTVVHILTPTSTSTLLATSTPLIAPLTSTASLSDVVFPQGVSTISPTPHSPPTSTSPLSIKGGDQKTWLIIVVLMGVITLIVIVVLWRMDVLARARRWRQRGQRAKLTDYPSAEPKSGKPIPTEPLPSVQPRAFLECITLSGYREPLRSDVTLIGRAGDCDIRIDERFPHWETVSHHHAEIRFESGRCVIYDLDSVNGVYVENRRTSRNLLRDGWRVAIGGVEFVYRRSTP